MVYEFRTYQVAPDRLGALHRRFRDSGAPLMKEHGFDVVGWWEPVVGRGNQLHYLLRWDDLASRDERWQAYRSDPRWVEARSTSVESGPIVVAHSNELWQETDYSLAFRGAK